MQRAIVALTFFIDGVFILWRDFFECLGRFCDVSIS
jgi:hypothetical protein